MLAFSEHMRAGHRKLSHTPAKQTHTVKGTLGNYWTDDAPRLIKHGKNHELLIGVSYQSTDY